MKDGSGQCWGSLAHIRAPADWRVLHGALGKTVSIRLVSGSGSDGRGAAPLRMQRACGGAGPSLAGGSGELFQLSGARSPAVTGKEQDGSEGAGPSGGDTRVFASTEQRLRTPSP